MPKVQHNASIRLLNLPQEIRDEIFGLVFGATFAHIDHQMAYQNRRMSIMAYKPPSIFEKRRKGNPNERFLWNILNLVGMPITNATLLNLINDGWTTDRSNNPCSFEEGREFSNLFRKKLLADEEEAEN